METSCAFKCRLREGFSGTTLVAGIATAGACWKSALQVFGGAEVTTSGGAASSPREILKRVPLLRAAVRELRRRKQIRDAQGAWHRYSASHAVRALNIGSGRHVLPKWFNVDCFAVYPDQYFVDAEKTFPFADSSFDFIRSEHMIEHVPYSSAMHMLRECHRVLRPGGIIRIATPDLKKLAGLYASPPSPERQRYADAVLRTRRPHYDGCEIGVVINNIFLFEDHRFIYDSGTLGEGLRKAGFLDILESAPGQSAHSAFGGTDVHATESDYITFETLTMEARKA